MAGNNYPTVTTLKETLTTSLLEPQNLLTAVTVYVGVAGDLMAKNMAGFPLTLTDPWGRLLSQQLLPGDDGSPGLTLSSVTKMTNFTQFNVPYPIITSLGQRTLRL